MKKFTLLCFLLVSISIFAQITIPFITTWQTTTANGIITIPTYGLLAYNYNVDWGDGSSPSVNLMADARHTYVNAGTYTVTITGTFPRIIFSGNDISIINIQQWGDNPWTSMNYAFIGCSNLTSTATDAPNLSNVTDMSFMFRGATAFNSDLSSWNVSSVTNMAGMFQRATAFNGNISSWNVSSVTYMYDMFYGAASFNQDLSSWNVSSVTHMYYMFFNATAFNGNISNWDVSSSISFNAMFYNAAAFNQDLGAWDISSAIDMANMFSGTLSTANYDNTLIGWSTLDTGAGETAIPTNIIFNGGNSTYCAVAARNTLTGSPYNWTITDGGKDAACGALGLNDYKLLNSLMIYPNPSRDMIYINGDVSKIKQLIIYDMLGKQVISSNKNFKAVNIEALNAGVYFVKLNTDESSKIIKFIKE